MKIINDHGDEDPQPFNLNPSSSTLLPQPVTSALGHKVQWIASAMDHNVRWVASATADRCDESQASAMSRTCDGAQVRWLTTDRSQVRCIASAKGRKCDGSQV